MEKQSNAALLTGKEGEEFDLELAASWTKKHREKNPGEPVSHFFGRDILLKILNQEGCMGIRIYHAYSEDDKKHVIITGATADGEDQVPVKEPLSKGDSKGVSAKSNFMVGQMSTPCPGSSNCPKGLLAGGK